ncbi:MAG: DMT family transporter [Gammaproteobacteria bacterium WSBS_2016_MAG_OTU1]
MANQGKKTTTTRYRAELMLLAATFFWGWTFPVVREAVATLPVFVFLFWRFLLATVMMMLIVRRLPPLSSWRFGSGLGVLLFFIFAFQTWGLLYTSSANSAFITGLNVVWVFLLQPGSWRRFWREAGLAVGGLWLLTRPDAEINIGDWLTLVCSLFVALHILLLDRLSQNESSSEMAIIQFAFVTLASLVMAIFLGDSLTVDWGDGHIVFALLLTAGGATVFSFWAQTHFQRYTTPMRAGLIFICEPVFAAIFSAGFYGELIPLAALPGAAMMLVAMILAIMRQK